MPKTGKVDMNYIKGRESFSPFTGVEMQCKVHKPAFIGLWYLLGKRARKFTEMEVVLGEGILHCSNGV